MPYLLFELGTTVGTPGAIAALQEDGEDASTYFTRHASGDWGEVDRDDWHANNRSVGDEARILSAYTLKSGRKVWVITEAARSCTTILLPEEY